MSLEEDLLAIALDVASAAGAFVAKKRTGDVEVAATKSSLVDVVTEVDRECEAMIHVLVRAARPGDGFFGEEGGTGVSTTGITWVVDPIDGTVNYLYGIPHYAVSIAAVQGTPTPDKWTVLAGVVNNPATGEVFSASRAGGAFLGNTRIQVLEPVELSQTLWLTGFAYAEEYRKAQGLLVEKIVPIVRDIRRMGTASLDLTAIAAGRANIYFERTLSPWDHAAGELIVREAGGVVCGFGDEAPSREAIFAGHPGMVRAFQQLVHENGGDLPLAHYL